MLFRMRAGTALDPGQERAWQRARAVVLGHLLRGGSPSSFDRIAAKRFGTAAVRGLAQGLRGVMVSLAHPNVVYVPLADIVSVERRAGFSTVRRENGLRVVTVTGDISEDDPARAAAVIHVETYVREDALKLFGFLSEAERAWYVRLQSVQGVGGKFFYGPGRNDRESDDAVFVNFEFPGPKHPKSGKGGTDESDIVVVSYSSFNTNSFEKYGECLMGSRGTMVVEKESRLMFLCLLALNAAPAASEARRGTARSAWP